MDSSGVSSSPVDHPPPRKPLRITAIPDLDDLHRKIDICNQNAMIVSKNDSGKPSRVQSMRRMKVLSRLLDDCSRLLEDNRHNHLTCCDNVREAVDLLQCFNSHFRIGLDARRSEELLEYHRAFSKVLTEAKERTNNYEIGNSFLKARNAHGILSPSGHSNYIELIRLIEDHLGKLDKRIKSRRGFLNTERREALRLLKACRRFRSFPNHGDSGDCSCEEDWDLTLWAKLDPGSPVTNQA